MRSLSNPALMCKGGRLKIFRLSAPRHILQYVTYRATIARGRFCIAASRLVLTSPMASPSPLALLCLLVLLRHVLTSHGGAWGSRGSPRRWTSSRTRCTCCRQGRAGESDPGHTRIRARSSTNRTIRSVSRRHGARESDLNRTRIRARSLSNRNVCILSPCQFSFR